MTEAMREAWDVEAEGFDNESDHGLRDPATRAAWATMLRETLPEPPARVLDVGSGTGTLSVLLAELGYDVLGVDLAPKMVERATSKAAAHGVDARFQVGDAGDPRCPAGSPSY